MQQTGIRGIVVNNRMTNVMRKKIGTKCAKLQRAKRKSGGFGAKRPSNKWRDKTWSVRLFYNTSWIVASLKASVRGFQRFQRGEFSLALRLCLRLSQRQDESLWSSVFVLVFSLNKSLGVSFWDSPFPCCCHVYECKLSLMRSIL